NLDQDLVPRLARADPQNAGRRLAGVRTVFGALDAVVDRVADDVGERIADHLDHLAVQLDVAAIDLKRHALAELARYVAHHAGQHHEQAVHALHARAGDRVAHLGDAAGKTLERILYRKVGRRFA